MFLKEDFMEDESILKIHQSCLQSVELLKSASETYASEAELGSQVKSYADLDAGVANQDKIETQTPFKQRRVEPINDQLQSATHNLDSYADLKKQNTSYTETIERLLGLKIEHDKMKNSIKFIFSNLLSDSKQKSSTAWITIQMTDNKNTWQFCESSPILKDACQYIENLNSSRNLSRFLTSVRKAFQAELLVGMAECWF